MKDLKLTEECCVTVHSIENAKILVKAYGIPSVITITGDPSEADHVVHCEWGRLFSKVAHDFTGFSWGYGGEGPRGLYVFLFEICHKSKVTPGFISNLELQPGETRTLY